MNKYVQQHQTLSRGMTPGRHSACGAFVWGLLTLLACCGSVYAAEFDAAYKKGDVISPEIFVADKAGSQVYLKSLLAEAGAEVNVLFIFGGGDLGSGMPGHLWCPDSFEDTHILRTLHGKYADQGVNFIAVGVAPVYHSELLGHKQGVFRNPQETQFYGVPGFWILDDEGAILAAPFRGNIYHPHGADVTINYTFGDIDKVLQGLL